MILIYSSNFQLKLIINFCLPVNIFWNYTFQWSITKDINETCVAVIKGCVAVTSILQTKYIKAAHFQFRLSQT